MAYEERKYRKLVKSKDLIKFTAIEKETDLLILADKNLQKTALTSIAKYRGEMENYLQGDPLFITAFKPYRIRLKAPQIIKDMASAARRAKVGPMAAVAGAIAEYVGKDLLKHSEEVIVENGGDIFMKVEQPKKIGIYAGKSRFSNKIAVEIDPGETPLGVCTSAGTVGHSVSHGKADAVVVKAKSAALADAAATAIGNVIKSPMDLDAGLRLAKKIKGLKGVLIIKDDYMGAWGKMKIVPM